MGGEEEEEEEKEEEEEDEEEEGGRMMGEMTRTAPQSAAVQEMKEQRWRAMEAVTLER